ncbi:MAG: hypothetical protein JOZ81_12650 [Chloroflexi bacterium]|nr:hypothetical protein [Chloroflexota bacterium]
MSQLENDRPRLLVRLLAVLVVLGALVQRRRPLPRGVQAEDLAGGYEHSDMNVAVVIAGAVGLLIVLGLVLIGVTIFEQTLTRTSPNVSRPQDLIQGLQGAPAPTPPLPQLEAQPGQTLDGYRAVEQQRLTSYGWIDRSTGTVHIPIDRAIELTAQRGLPARATSSAQDQGTGRPSVPSSGRVEEAYP